MKFDSIALVVPPYDEYSFKVGESLGIRYISSILRDHGYHADVYEPVLLRWDLKRTVEELIRGNYDIVGISTSIGLIKNIIELAKALRTSGYDGKIILGGHFATFEYIKILKRIPEIDGVIVGEGEIPTLKLMEGDLRYLATRNNTSPLTAFVENLDVLPFPYRDDLRGKEHYSVLSSRGCYGRCIFCSVPIFYQGRIRLRSAENVVNELEMLVSEYNAKAVSFVDDNFIMGKYGKKRAIKIAQDIRRRKIDLKFIIAARANDIDLETIRSLKDAGLVGVEIGFESASRTQLRRYNKGITPEIAERAIKILRELGIRIIPFFINFDPYVTLEEIKNNIKFMVKHGFVTYKNLSNTLAPYPGTPIYYQLKSEGKLLEHDWEYYYKFEDARVRELYKTIRSSEFLKIVDLIQEILQYWTDIGKGDYSEELSLIRERMNQFASRLLNEPRKNVIQFSKDITWEVLSLKASRKVIKEILGEKL